MQELDLYDIETLDPELGRTLFEMQVLVRRKQFVEASGQSVDGLRFRGSRVEDLCLDFTLPGYPEYELKSEGRDVTVRGMCGFVFWWVVVWWSGMCGRV